MNAPKKRGRQRTVESIQSGLQKVDDELKTADPLRALTLRQQRIDLMDELDQKTSTVEIDLTALGEDFKTSAKAYSDRKGISYAVCRGSGVPAEVFKAAARRRCGTAAHSGRSMG